MPLATLVALLMAPSGAEAKSGEDVIRAMHERYAKTWYKKVTFVQRAIWFDGLPEAEWWEALRSPGRLRIDVAPIGSGDATIYRNGSIVHFAKRKVVSTAAGENVLLVLGFDVYCQAPETTIAILKRQGFDLSKVREDTWQGKPAYVIGAAKGDEKTRQFWIEKDRLLFLRVVEPSPKDGASSDIRFDKYVKLGGGWLGTEVLFYRDGKLSFHEIYRDWKINDAVTDDLFDTKRWRWPSWVKKN